MQLLTAKVYDKSGGHVVVNLEDVARWVSRGYSTVNPTGGTFSREPIARPDSDAFASKSRKSADRP